MKKKWFAAKRYGWGWYPVTWQGWGILGVYTGFVIYRVYSLDTMFDTTSPYIFRLILETLIATIILIAICWKTGEKPRWRWGK